VNILAITSRSIFKELINDNEVVLIILFNIGFIDKYIMYPTKVIFSNPFISSTMALEENKRDNPPIIDIRLREGFINFEENINPCCSILDSNSKKEKHSMIGKR
jgi:hypothetical protein